jgi:GNAT superfamily N-acetyltransferase
MNLPQLLALYDQDQRIDVQYPLMERQLLPDLVRHVNTASTGQGMVIYAHLTETTIDAAIREQIAFFTKVGQDFEWKVYQHDSPADLLARLTAFGFEIGNPEAILIMETEHAPAILRRPATHPIRRVTDVAEIEVIRQVEEAVWQEDHHELVQQLRETFVDYPSHLSLYIGYVADRPVSCAWSNFPEGSQFASFWGGSTLEEFRGRGLYTAMLAVRVQEAIERGRPYLTVDAGPMSRPILEKFGFQLLDISHPCVYHVNGA